MIYERKEDGTSKLTVFRKQYKKARYIRRVEREIKWMDKNCPGWHGVIIW